jgi:hypothetical protein
MNRLSKLILRIRTLPKIVVSRGVKVSDSHAFVIARASASDIYWYFADNIADKRLKKTRKA